MEISDDNKTVKLAIDDTFTAQELDGLIGELAALRSAMEPPVPIRCPFPPEAPFVPVAIEADPTFKVFKSNQTGIVRLVMRSSGVGWIAFDLNSRNANTLANWFRDNIEGISALEEADIKAPPQ